LAFSASFYRFARIRLNAASSIAGEEPSNCCIIKYEDVRVKWLSTGAHYYGKRELIRAQPGTNPFSSRTITPSSTPQVLESMPSTSGY
jgi:hypothetical protein